MARVMCYAPPMIGMKQIELRVEATYAEVFVSEDCAFETRVSKLIPGSKTRQNIVLPGPMKEGEQLTVLVERSPR